MPEQQAPTAEELEVAAEQALADELREHLQEAIGDDEPEIWSTIAGSVIHGLSERGYRIKRRRDHDGKGLGL